MNNIKSVYEENGSIISSWIIILNLIIVVFFVIINYVRKSELLLFVGLLIFESVLACKLQFNYN